MEFSRQEYWSGLPFPFPVDLPNPGKEPESPALQADSLATELVRLAYSKLSILSSHTCLAYISHAEYFKFLQEIFIQSIIFFKRVDYFQHLKSFTFEDNSIILSNVRIHNTVLHMVALVVKKTHLPMQETDVRDTGLIPGSGRSPGGGHGNPLQYSCLENPMDRGTW